jgi:hypothetical protein
MIQLDIPIEQSKRQHSADLAMAHRIWTVLDGKSGWKVRTEHDTYSIVPLSGGSRLTCSCPDNQHLGPLGIECKHIRGLMTYLEEGGAPRPQKHVQQGDRKMNSDFLKENGWVKLFHPSTAQVTIPLPLDKPILVQEAQALMESVSNLLKAGFSVDVPGLEEGEHAEEIGFVVRRSKANTDGTETPVVDLYPARGNFRLLGKYLNDEDEIRVMEAACGLKLANLPLYEGDNSIERGKNTKLDKYVAALAHPVKVIWKLNPKYTGEQDKSHSKRIFVRWDASLPLAEPPAAMSLNEARTCVCPLGTKSHPEYKGQTLDQIAQAEDGRKVLEYLVSDQYQPNGDKSARRAKEAASILLAALTPA